MSQTTLRDAIAPTIVGIAAGAADFVFAYVAPNAWGRAIACGIVAGLVGLLLLRRSR